MNSASRHCSPSYLLALTSLSLVIVGCGAEDLNSRVQLKRGSYVRVINLTNIPATAKADERHLATYDVGASEAPFVLMPPSSKTLTVKFGNKQTEAGLSLKANEAYTFVCVDSRSGIKCLEFQGDPTHAKDGGSNMRILNATDAVVTVSKPENLDVAPEKASKVLTMSAISTTVDGKSGGQKVEPSTMDLRPNGAYISLIYKSPTGVKSKIFYSNPPMQAAGMSNPNR